MNPTTLSKYSQLLHFPRTFSTQEPSEFSALEVALNDLSRELVTNKTLRVQLGSQQPSIWVPLRELWNEVIRAQSAGIDMDGRSSQLLVSLAKFTRNLIADVPHNQKNAFSLEPQIRQLIYLHTAWSRDDPESAFATTRVLTQTLANLVTGNQDLIDQFWGVHMAIPEEQSVLIRLLGLPDLRSVVSALVLILNCVHNNSERGHALVTTSIGIRICIFILDKLEGLSDVSELEDEAKVFELGYAIFSKLFHFGFFPELYTRTSMDNEPVSPSQTILLKLLDTFCHPVPTPFHDHLSNLASFLPPVFLLQAEYAQRAIQQAIGNAPTHHSGPSDMRGSAAQGPDFALDGRLAGVCVTLVLLSTTLSSILLAEREIYGRGARTGPAGVVTLTRLCHDAITTSRNPTGSGFIEELLACSCSLETLRLLDRFLPRVNTGKIKPLSPNGQEGVPGGGRPSSADAAGFPYLKRDLVRLLGILCHNCKAIQDRIRLCGGIPVVLNLCVIDDRNPYLREHALFALRNVLHNSPENQAVVDTFREEETRGPLV